MPRRRFYVPPENIRGQVARLGPEQTHHLRNVLRIRPGESVEVFDGRGRGYRGRVEKDGNRLVVVSLEILDPPAESPVDVVLAQALIRMDRFEWILEKAAELGVSEVVPLLTRFTKVRVTQEKTGVRLERWERIAQEACRQCGRTTVPRIHRPSGLEELLRRDSIPRNSRFLFYEKAVEPWIAGAEREGPFLLCLGPEGGWHPDEIRTAEAAGCRMFRLGPRVLRAETAAVSAIAILQYQAGDLGTQRHGR